jgi:hypothetical protein
MLLNFNKEHHCKPGKKYFLHFFGQFERRIAEANHRCPNQIAAPASFAQY